MKNSSVACLNPAKWWSSANCTRQSRREESERHWKRCIPPFAALSSTESALFSLRSDISLRFPARIARSTLHGTSVDSHVCTPAAAFRTPFRTRKSPRPASHSPPSTRTSSTFSRKNKDASRAGGRDRRLPRGRTRASRDGSSPDVPDTAVCMFRRVCRWGGSAKSISMEQIACFPTCFPQFSSFPHGWSQQTTVFLSEQCTRRVSCPPAH